MSDLPDAEDIWAHDDSSVLQRFTEKVEIRSSQKCWLWVAAKNPYGYGRMGIGGRNGRTVYAHRLSWRMANEEAIPEGLCVCHDCDNPACVNPSHLFLGTREDNMHDMIEKGREDHTRNPIGEEHGQAKLTEIQVIDIRQEYQETDILQRELADRYGVTQKSIHNIVNRKTWKHI